MSPLALSCHDPTLWTPASAPGNAARLRTAARHTPPAHQYSTPFHLYFSIMSGFSFCAAVLAVPTVLPASRCPAAPSAPVGAPVLRRSICFRRGPSSHLWGFLSVSAITTSPTSACRVPALSCSPASLRAFPPLLVPFTPSFYHPLPLPTPRVLLSCSPPRFSSAHPSCISLPPGPWRTSWLLPYPTSRLRTTPPTATVPAASEPWASSPSPRDGPGSPLGAPLPASSSTSPPPSEAPSPRTSLPC